MNSAATSYVEITNHKSCKIQHRSLPRHPGWACRLICSFYIELRRVGTAKSIVLTIFDLSKWYKSYATLNISYALYICQDRYQMSSHLWHLLFQVFAHGAIHYSSSDTFLLAQLPTSSSSDSAHALEGAVHGKRREYFIFWLQLFSV